MESQENAGQDPETDASGQQHGDAGGDVVQGDKVVNGDPPADES